jgi:hypothetical protein
MSYNYYNYKSERFTCPKCNWNGLGSETFLSDLSETHIIRCIECPDCEETLHVFDLAKVELPKDNPLPDEKVCFNCTNMLLMVGIGQGVQCRLTKEMIPNKHHTCDSFKIK